jgi:hypothetical protein
MAHTTLIHHVFLHPYHLAAGAGAMATLCGAVWAHVKWIVPLIKGIFSRSDDTMSEVFSKVFERNGNHKISKKELDELCKLKHAVIEERLAEGDDLMNKMDAKLDKLVWHLIGDKRE